MISHSVHLQAWCPERQRERRRPFSASPAARVRLAGMGGRCTGTRSLVNTPIPDVWVVHDPGGDGGCTLAFALSEGKDRLKRPTAEFFNAASRSRRPVLGLHLAG